MGAILGIIAAVAPAIIKWVEAKHGAGKGQEKKQDATDVLAALAAALAGGAAPADLLANIPGIIEAFVQLLKSKGELQSPPAPAPAPIPVSGPGLIPSGPNFSVPFSITGTIKVGA